MTEKEYEGTPELIFYCEYNPNDFEDRLEIPFTNEYDIKLNFSRDTDNQIRINVDLQPKESNIPKGFFGKNILNVTAIAGKNGVGKTTIFKNLYSYSSSINNEVEIIRLYKISKEKYFIDMSDSRHICILNKFSPGPIPDDHAEIVLLFDDKFLSEIERKQKRERINQLVCKLPISDDKSNLYKFLQSDIKHYTHLPISEILEKAITISVKCIEDDELRHHLNSSYFSNLSHKMRFLISGVFSVIKHQPKLLQTVMKLNKPRSDILDDIFKRVDFILCACIEHQQGLGNSLQYFDAQMLSHLNILLHIRQLIEGLDDSYFEQIESEVVLNVSIAKNDIDAEKFVQLISKITSNKSDYKVLEDVFSINFGGYSAGEEFILNTFANFKYAIDFYTQSHLRTKTIIFCIDEYEKSLHPEWSRKYLFYLLSLLNEEVGQLRIKFQIILTTHSPYLISDLPKENIILLEKDKKTGKRTARKSNYGFASNYYDIMSDSFFLDDTIGEFAKQKINGCIQAINRISDDLDKLANDELILHDGLSLFIEESLETIEEQNKIIDLVGDKFIQKQLQQLLDSVKQRLLVHSDDSVRKQQLEQDIAELEERIRQKKMELNHD